jgi:predicted cytidylate kinase
MRVTISGPPGSGKTTVCQLLAKRLGLEVVISGRIFRQLASESGLSLTDFGRACELDPSVDKKLDHRIVEIAKTRDDIVIEGRLAGFMLQRHGIPAFKVFMDAELEVRAERVVVREGGTVSQKKKEIAEREECEARRYRSYYDIDIEDKSIYDLVVDTTRLMPEQVIDIIASTIDAWDD